MPSSLIGVLQRDGADTDSTCPESFQLTGLADVLAGYPIPAGSGAATAWAPCSRCCSVAILGGATSLAAIAGFAADTDSGPRQQLRLAKKLCKQLRPLPRN
ncbi:hypothetical protein [Streptomyces sp. NBC_01455]|uniref:hypothetical protein n=1 Tax=Streptomyces sp. NBC_01455 TaxID=2903874 RepID=UPI002E3313D9|nr:hypothetical protein [Streptomyces sp. NBC_01455]